MGLRTKDESDGCSRCDVSDPACLDFHHRDQGEKQNNVTDLVRNGCAEDRIRAEIRHCTLVCANCHWKDHHGNLPAELVKDGANLSKEERLRAWTYEYKREKGCKRCGEDDAVCLQFHHVEEKRMGVGRMIAYSYPESLIRAEVQRCVVLCANCHRKEHYTNPIAEGGYEADSSCDNT